MAWNIIRKATQEDRERLDDAARRFITRHNLYSPDYNESPVGDVECVIYGDSDRAKELRKLWRAVLRRALREQYAEGIAWGYIGYHSD